MSRYDIRRPQIEDEAALDTLLIGDYRNIGAERPALTQEKTLDLGRRGWAAFNLQNGSAEAVVLSDRWRYGDVKPYSRLPMGLLRLLDMAGWYEGHTGVFVMSATVYSEDGPLSELVDHPEVRALEPKDGPVHVPLVRGEHDAYDFLLGRGFRPEAEAKVPLFGAREMNLTTGDEDDSLFDTVLMTKKNDRHTIIV